MLLPPCKKCRKPLPDPGKQYIALGFCSIQQGTKAHRYEGIRPSRRGSHRHILHRRRRRYRRTTACGTPCGTRWVFRPNYPYRGRTPPSPQCFYCHKCLLHTSMCTHRDHSHCRRRTPRRHLSRRRRNAQSCNSYDKHRVRCSNCDFPHRIIREAESRRHRNAAGLSRRKGTRVNIRPLPEDFRHRIPPFLPPIRYHTCRSSPVSKTRKIPASETRRRIARRERMR